MLRQVESKVKGWIRQVAGQIDAFGNMQPPDESALEACRQTLEQLRAFEAHLPVIMCLRAPGMRDRHWVLLNSKTGLSLSPDPSLTLFTLLQTGIGEHTAALEEVTRRPRPSHLARHVAEGYDLADRAPAPSPAQVAYVAAQEYAVERALERMASEWRAVEMPLEMHGVTETYVLAMGGIDEIYSMLDEQLVKTMAMRGSPYIGPFEERVNTWSATLTQIQV